MYASRSLVYHSVKTRKIKLNKINQKTHKYQSENMMVFVFVCNTYYIYIYYILIRVDYTYIFLKELFNIYMFLI